MADRPDIDRLAEHLKRHIDFCDGLHRTTRPQLLAALDALVALTRETDDWERRYFSAGAEADEQRERAEAAEADRDRIEADLEHQYERAERLADALREIEELCEHWRRHDETDPGKPERWRLAAIRRAQMIGNHAHASLSAADRTDTP